jgi:hypothetical protein
MIRNDKSQITRVMEVLDTYYDPLNRKLILSGIVDSIALYDVSAEAVEEIMQKLFDEGKIDLSNNPTNEKAVL